MCISESDRGREWGSGLVYSLASVLPLGHATVRPHRSSLVPPVIFLYFAFSCSGLGVSGFESLVFAWISICVFSGGSFFHLVH